MARTEIIEQEQTAASRGPIGVFDSGIGGLTVVAALRKRLPTEDIFYVGDTARVPYGGKSRKTIERYSVEMSGLLFAEEAKMIVVACNTSSAWALPRLRELFRAPVLGVIQPGAEAAIRVSRSRQIGVMGTRATIASGAYERAIHAMDPTAQVLSMPCPLLVPLIEEGMLEDAITDLTLRRYLQPLLSQGIDTLVLGCTHYPLLREAIAHVVGPDVTLVDSADNCALAVCDTLSQHAIAAESTESGTLRVALTDAAEGFLRVAERTLGLDIGEVQLRAVQGI